MKRFIAKIFIPWGGQYYVQVALHPQGVVFEDTDHTQTSRVFNNTTAPTATHYPDAIGRHKPSLDRVFEMISENQKMIEKSDYYYARLGEGYKGPMHFAAAFTGKDHHITVELKPIL